NRLELVLDAIGDAHQSHRQTAGRHEHADLQNRRDQRRRGNDPEENVGPAVHAFSRALACWYASRPRSMAVVSVSRPWLTISRPRSAALVARSLLSRAFSPRYSR